MIKIINYKPYEYELLQEKLSKWGEKGYQTKDLSFISFFKKTDSPVYYQIDFYQPEGESRNDKIIDETTFISSYTEKGYTCIYKKNNMYVFSSTKSKPLSIKWNRKLNIVKTSTRFLSLFFAFISVVIASMFCYYLLSSPIDNFLSYGIFFAYIGFLFACMTSAFRNYFNFYGLSIFKSRVENQKPSLNQHKLLLLRKVYIILSIITIILIGGGFIEDTINVKEFSTSSHPIIKLDQLGIDKPTTLSTQSYSGFFSKHTYISLESTKKDEALYIKEYQMSSPQKALSLFDNLSKNPQNWRAKEFKRNNNVVYGYYDTNIVSMIILKENSVITLVPSFVITTQQADEIAQFYS